MSQKPSTKNKKIQKADDRRNQSTVPEGLPAN